MFKTVISRKNPPGQIQFVKKKTRLREEKKIQKKNTRTSRLNGTKMSSRITWGGLAKTHFICLYKRDSSCRLPPSPPLHSYSSIDKAKHGPWSSQRGYQFMQDIYYKA